MSIKPEGTTNSKIVIKLLLLGDVSVGKSSLLVRYADHKFDNNRVTTIGIQNRNVNVLLDGKPVSLQIWDTAGQQKWRQVPPSYYRGVRGIILVYDLSSRSTFDLINEWMVKIAQSTDIDKLSIALVGNKSDLQRQIQFQQGNNFAKQHKVLVFLKQMMFQQTSAKTDANVAQLFSSLAKTIISKGNFESKCTKLQTSQKKISKQNDCC